MEAPPYTDTILLEANRKSSAEYLAGNNDSKSSWTNNMGNGVKLDIGDTISVHSAYISEIGNEDSTIEIKGRKAINNLGQEQKYTSTNVTLKKTEGELSNGIITEAKTSEGNYGWDYTVDKNVENIIRDDEINLTHSYYKCAQGDNYFTLPRKWGAEDRRGWFDGATNWSQYDSASMGDVYSRNPYRLGTDYSDIRKFGQPNGYGFSPDTEKKSDRTTISHDGRRFTLFVRRSFKNYVPDGEKTGFYLQGERDPAMMDFIWYKKTVKYNVTKGFNSPANVASQITNKMTDTIKIENISLGEDNDGSGSRRDGQIKMNNLNLEAQSNTYEIFPCSTAWFLRNAGELWFNDTYSTNVGVPLTQDNTYHLDVKTNVLSFNFSGTYPEGGKQYNASGLFSDGYLRTGWKVVNVYNANTDAVVTEFNWLKGVSLCNIREYAHSKDVTVAGFDQEYLGPEVDVDATTFIPVARFTNEHLPIQYESCYSTVGYLRPEIQEAGREFNAGFNQVVNITIDKSFKTLRMTHPMNTQQDAQGNDQPSTILTQIPWTDENLLALKKLFEAQSLYPELFNYDGMSASQKVLINVTEDTKDNVSVNTMRFLHMNDKTQETFTGTNVEVQSIDDTDFGEQVNLTSASGLKKGMRIYLSDVETDEHKLYPSDTFITGINGNTIYVSNPHNASVDVAGEAPFYIYCAQNGLGSDNYTNASDVAQYLHSAGAVFFDYNPARKDISTGEGLGTDPYETLTYGFAKKVTYFNKDYIGFYVGKYQGGTLPDTWFDPSDYIDNRCIGFDKHFNAFGTGAILLTNGEASPWGGDYNASTIEGSKWSKVITNKDPDTDTLPEDDVGKMFRCFRNQPTGDGWFISTGPEDQAKYGPAFDDPNNARLVNEIYCGANQPALQFDSSSSRFSFTNLHTPERIGTNASFIGNASDISDSDLPCYKLNKRLDRLNYSPDFIPYNNVYKVALNTKITDETVVEKDNSITPYAIMDAQGGIFIEDYGCDEKNWGQSLWELMGFTYSQFHNQGSRLQRLTNVNLPTSTPTTNALIKTEDLQNLVKMGSSQLPVTNTLTVNYPLWRYTPKAFDGSENFAEALQQSYLAFPGNMSYPPVAQQAVSTNIEADNLPRKMLSPIYLIKTDLLNPKYIGGREGTSALPIIGVVDKSSGYGDFYTGARDATIFTNTIPRTIQNIKTSIVDADGSDSRVDDSCCVIYKITKQIKNNSVVLTNILNPPKK